jgi:hypothetical protein
VNTGTQGRNLLREIDRGDLIGDSYDRVAYGPKWSEQLAGTGRSLLGARRTSLTGASGTVRGDHAPAR